MHRLLGSTLASTAAWFIAQEMGVPIWRQWQPGDRADIALLVFAACWVLSYRKVAP